MSSVRERFEAMQRRERVMVTVLGVVGVLAIAYMLFLRGGGAAPELHPPTGTPPTRKPTPSPTVTTTTSPKPVPPGSFGGKDPFEPLVTADTGSTPAPSGTSTPGSSGGPSSGGGSTTTGKTNRVTLVDIFRRSGHLIATVQVNGKSYTVEPGDQFDGNFQLISLTSRCGVFAFGDERFTLCVGQEVRK
jgi:hypothetical protein